MIGDDDLRDCFAMFAMLGFMSRGSVWEVKEAWDIADAMLEARTAKEEKGIVAVRKRKVK